MSRDPAKNRRRFMRLKGFDYTRQGAYFITICTKERACLFGEVVDGVMRLNDAGHIVEHCWRTIPDHCIHAQLDAFVVMPNHVHGIVVLVGSGAVGATHASPLPDLASSGRSRGPRRQSIASIIGSFKSAVTKRINDIRKTAGALVWQRNYYEHVIRNEESFNRIRQYILDNPLRWAFDRENPAASDPEPLDAWAQ